MSVPTSPSPAPKWTQQPSTLLPSSIFSTPSFSSTLPLPRPTSASGAYRRTPSLHKQRGSSSQRGRRRRTRSVASSVTASSDGSLDDFSMENYTIDLAQLARGQGGGPPLRSRSGATDGVTYSRYSDGQDVDRAPAMPTKEQDMGGESDDDVDDFMGDYAIDLGGFGDKPSSVVVEDREVEREEIASEDEGPEDFTVNLEKWMRGTGVWRKGRRDGGAGANVGLEEDHPQKDAPDGGLEDAFGEESISEPLGTSTPAPLKNHAIIEAGMEEEAREQAPPRSLLNTEMIQDQTAEEVFERISALQAEVERMRVEDERWRVAHERWEQEIRRLREENEHIQDVLQEKDHKLAAYAGNDMESREKIQALTVELRASHDTVRSLRTDIVEKTNTPGLEVKGLKTELEKSRTEAESTQIRITKLEGETRLLTEKSQKKDQTLGELTGELSAMRTELTHAHEQLRETRRIVETVENENDRLSQQNERQGKDLTEIDQILGSRSIELQAAHATIAQLRGTTKHAQTIETAPTTIDADTHNAALASLTHTHETTLSSLNAKHAKDLQLLRSALQKMQKRESRLTTTHREKLSHLNEQLASSNPQPHPAPAIAKENTELRTAIRVLTSKLEKAIAAARAARSETEAVHASAELVSQNNALVNAELESCFASTVEAREREWNRRVALLFREREKMAKALLLGWGREEVGVGDGGGGQGYRYRFVERGRVRGEKGDER